MSEDPKILKELERIAAENGGVLKAERVVEAARSETSPLHDEFDWEDSKAAHKWRLHQARKLINVVVSYETVGNKEKVATRVFVSLSSDRQEPGGGYRVLATVLSDDVMRAELLADARREMLQFRQKYAALSELAKVFEEMERAGQESSESAVA